MSVELVLHSSTASVKPSGGVPRDQSSNPWSGEFLVGGVEKKLHRLSRASKAFVKWTGPPTR